MDTVANQLVAPGAPEALTGNDPPVEGVAFENCSENPSEFAQAPNLPASEDAAGRSNQVSGPNHPIHQLAILDALPAHVALLDSVGTIVAVNEAWRRFGEQNVLQIEESCIGSNYIKVCEAAQGECSGEAGIVAEGIRKVLDKSLLEFSLEYPCHSPTEQRWFRLMVSPLQAGPSVGAVVMHINITERKLAEIALSESEERFRTMFLDAATGICICTLEGRFLQANAAYLRMLGYTEGELLALDFRSITHPEDQPRNFALVADLMAGHIESFVIVKRYIGKIGNVVWCKVSVSAQRGANGGPVNLIAVAEDITQQREAEEELARSQALLRMATHVSRLGAWSIEVATGALYWSGDSVMFPDVPDDFVPTLEGALAVCSPEYRNAVAEAFVTCVHDRTTFDVEFEVVGDSRSRGWVRAIGEPVLGMDGETIRVQGAFQDISALKTAERREHQLAQQLALTLESITDGFLMLDLDANITYMNDSAEKLLGRSRSGLLGRNAREEFAEISGAELELQYQRAVAGGVPTEFDQYLPLDDQWIGVRVFPIPNGLAVYVKDISEKRRARKALEDSEERFRLLSKATNDAIWDWDLETDTLWWNEGLETIFGYRPNDVDVASGFWSSRIHPDDRDSVGAGIQHALKSDAEQWSAEYRFLCHDGMYAFVLDRGYIIRKGGVAVRMLGCMTDISGQKKAEARLAEQAALLNLASDAIMVRDMDHTVLFWNRGAESIYGWTENEVRGKSVVDFLLKSKDDIRAAEAILLRDGVWSGEIQHRTRQGGVVTVFARWTLVRDESGNPKSVLAINSDITERRSLEQQILRAQRMESIGTLAGGIAHDLNNVLAPILLAVDILDDRVSDESGRIMVDTVRKCAQRGADLIKQVLAFARGEEGRRITVDLRQLARDIQKIVYDTFPRNIHCEIGAENDLWAITADPTQLHQVLMNLCVNARDAMPRGGQLAINLENCRIDEVYSGMNMDAQPGPYVKITVSDTGVGIPRDVQDRIFEPFFTTKEVGNGTGLGLSTTFTIVQDHRGFIDFKSETGTGSTFSVFVPALVGEVASESSEVDHPELPRGKGELILLVDDEESIREVTRRALERFGYRVLVASNGAEGVSAYLQHQREVAIVITDMSMPVMDGPSMIIALKSLNPDVRVIGSSGLADNSQIAKVAGVGVEHFVPKPYTAAVLLRLLKEILTVS